VVGITGSVGKSTSKELISDVLSQQFYTLRSPGNLNNEIGLPLTLLRLRENHQCAVLEMGFYVAGEIRQLCDIALPQIGVITNIGTVHAERAGSQEAIVRGKAELVEHLPDSGFAVLNYDDPLVRPMAAQTRAKVFYYGLDSRADLWADEITSQGLEGIEFRLHYKQDEMTLRLPLIGRHSVHTALRAAAVGILFGMPTPEIIQGMKSSRTQLRLMAVKSRSGALLIDDSYNASPESTMAALNLLGEMPGRKIAVLGGMFELGQYEDMGHTMVGARAGEVADFLLGVGTLSQKIIASARQRGLSSVKCAWAADTDGAREILLPMLHEGDVVLVKGSHVLRLDRLISSLEMEE